MGLLIYGTKSHPSPCMACSSFATRHSPQYNSAVFPQRSALWVTGRDKHAHLLQRSARYQRFGSWVARREPSIGHHPRARVHIAQDRSCGRMRACTRVSLVRRTTNEPACALGNACSCHPARCTNSELPRPTQQASCSVQRGLVAGSTCAICSLLSMCGGGGAPVGASFFVCCASAGYIPGSEPTYSTPLTCSSE